MKKRTLILATLGVVSTPQLIAAAKGDKPLNVLIIMADDMNGYGSLKAYPEIISPNLDALRQTSINFVTNSCACPLSGPSRTSFYSGLYPHTSGGYSNQTSAWTENPNMSTPEKCNTLPECFQNSGYTTWGGGKIFHTNLTKGRSAANFDNKMIIGGFGPFKQDYKHESPYQWLEGTMHFAITPWDDKLDEEHPDVKVTNAAMKFLDESHDKPFMMCVGLWRPHTPYNAPERFFELYKDKLPLPMPEGFDENDLDDVPFMGREFIDSMQVFKLFAEKKPNFDPQEKLEKFIHAYCANLSFADWNIGRLVEALEKSKYADNTVVIICADNGYHCGEKYHWEKSTLWEQSAYVPLFIKLPKSMQNSNNSSAKGGVECSIPVNLIDIYPTLVDLCGLKTPPQKLDGESIVPIINNPKMKSDRTSLTTFGEQCSSVRDEQYRLIKYFNGDMELYDLKNDKYEHTNLVDNPKYKSVVERLSKKIPTKWAKKVGGKETPMTIFPDSKPYDL